MHDSLRLTLCLYFVAISFSFPGKEICYRLHGSSGKSQCLNKNSLRSSRGCNFQPLPKSIHVKSNRHKQFVVIRGCCPLTSAGGGLIDSEADALEEWLIKMGAEGIGSKVKIQRSALGGRGLFATTDIKPGDCVLLLPSKLVITEETVRWVDF